MAKFNTRVIIEKPVGEVYTAFMNEEIAHKWLSGYKRAEPISGTPGEIGSKHKMYFEEQGREVVMIEEITERKENEKFSFHMEHDKISSDNYIYFTPLDGNRTELNIEAEVKAKGLFKFAFPALKSMLQKRQDGDFGRFKRLVEG